MATITTAVTVTVTVTVTTVPGADGEQVRVGNSAHSLDRRASKEGNDNDQ